MSRPKTTTVEITDANAWRHRLTGLAADTWYDGHDARLHQPRRLHGSRMVTRIWV